MLKVYDSTNTEHASSLSRTDVNPSSLDGHIRIPDSDHNHHFDVQDIAPLSSDP